ncbi:MAG: ribosome recycling factor [Acidobacteriota bacterium]|jgi:ribosome recycling factor|nr:ribosome recycling factor [Bryobacteraceae bacterium CoA2 C42]MCA2968550.1 ribosome recycling factor [Acidobacteriaceae bacterium]
MSQTFTTVKEVEAHAKQRMEKVLADMQHDTASLRTGRASVNLLDSIQVEAYGMLSPLSHVATLHVPEPAMITVQPFDRSQIKAIETAIRNSDLGLNPSNDGNLIRLPIPPLNQERRKELVKKLLGMTEDHRVAVRNIRRDANDAVKKLLKDKAISEDDERRALDDIQKLTDALIVKLDQVSKAKEKELLDVK